MPSSMVVQAPKVPTHLFLLFHGVGATPYSLEPVGEMLAGSFKNAVVVLVQAPHPADVGHGYQWFSVQGVTEGNRADRIKVAMTKFVKTVKKWQKKYKLNAEDTTLIGFSQGAIMSLSSTQMVEEIIATKIVSLSGRFATLPRKTINHTQVHFIHGDQDDIIDHRISRLAHEALLARGVTTTYDLIPNLGHSVNQNAMMFLLQRL